MGSATIDDLPNEILEHVLGFLLPYKDFRSCSVVCRRWHSSVQNVVRLKKFNFSKAIGNFGVVWSQASSEDPCITKRYSHSACTHENYMYVFGGCTCTSTTFNDLWRLDLSLRKWERLLTVGSYPSPKACASLVHYNNTLVLFGGWTHPSPYPLHQASRIFNELHFYDIKLNQWIPILSPTQKPPSTAGHSATVHGDNMVVFGGLQDHTGGTNDVWCFHLTEMSWTKMVTSEKKPRGRYGHSQIAIDDTHLFIIGGWGGSPSIVMNEIWMLTLTGPVWTWTEIMVDNLQSAASQLWCHPAVKVGDYVVAMSRNPNAPHVPLSYTKWVSSNGVISQRITAHIQGQHGRMVAENARLVVDRDVNVNGRRGFLLARRLVKVLDVSAPHVPPPLGKIMIAFREEQSTSQRKRERQLHAIQKMEDRLKDIEANKRVRPLVKKPPPMAMFVLDITGILNPDGPHIKWLPVRTVAVDSPETTILYSLVVGKGELIMFGGIQKDPNALVNPKHNQPYPETGDSVTNSLYFLSAPNSLL